MKKYLLTIYPTLPICRWIISIEKDINVIYSERSPSKKKKKQGLQGQEMQWNGQNMPFWNKHYIFGKSFQTASK